MKHFHCYNCGQDRDEKICPTCKCPTEPNLHPCPCGTVIPLCESMCTECKTAYLNEIGQECRDDYRRERYEYAKEIYAQLNGE